MAALGTDNLPPGVSAGPVPAATNGLPAAPSTTVTFSHSGSYTLQLTASDSRIATCSEISLTVAPNTNVFEDWIAAAFPGNSNPAVIGPAADPDGDGVQNMMEFALGMSATVPDAHPFSPGVAGLPAGAIMRLGGTDYLALLVRRPMGRLGITYGAEVSGDLLLWTAAIQGGLPVSNGDGSEGIIYRNTVPTAQSPLRFMRLRVTK